MPKIQVANSDQPFVEQETYMLPIGVVLGLSSARGELVKLYGTQILEGKAPLMDKKTQKELCRLIGDFINDLYKLKRENELLKKQREIRRQEFIEIHKMVLALGGRMTQDTQEKP